MNWIETVEMWNLFNLEKQWYESGILDLKDGVVHKRLAAIKCSDTVIKSSHIGPDGWMDTRYFASRSHKTDILVGMLDIAVRDRKEVHRNYHNTPKYIRNTDLQYSIHVRCAIIDLCLVTRSSTDSVAVNRDSRIEIP